MTTKQTNIGNMQTGYGQRRKIANIVVYIILAAMVLIWIFPIVWLVFQSFNGKEGVSLNTFFPEVWTFDNYIKLFRQTGAENPMLPISDTNPEIVLSLDRMPFPYGRWLLNTFIVAVFSCLISTLIILMVSYALSRLRFKSRKMLMNFGLILGMFPGFMSMAAIYNIMEIIGLGKQLFSLVIVYSSGAGLGYQIAKGFFDTIPRSLDEAAKIDGATRNQIFWIIILPLSKPIIVYTALTTFLGPWADYVFVSYFMKGDDEKFTVAMGLYEMLRPETMNEWFTVFCAGAVVIAVPITILFTIMQRFYVAGVTGGAVKG